MVTLISWKRSWLLWLTVLCYWGDRIQRPSPSFNDAFSIHEIRNPKNNQWCTSTPLSPPSTIVASMTSMQTSSAYTFTIVEENFNESINILDTTMATAVTSIKVNVSSVSISSPRLWLESLPNGAYTVMRCDYYTNMVSERYEDHWKIWGIDFHLRRLQQSYLALHGWNDTRMLNNTLDSLDADDQERGIYLKKAHDDTIAICSALKRKKEIWHLHENESVASEDPTTIMLTVLWYRNIERNEIQVIAHATKSNVTLMTTTKSIPWNIVLDTTSTPLIHRQSYPQPLAKVSTWCHQRRPLESQYMPTSSISLSDCKTDSYEVKEHMSVTINEIILTQQITATGHIQLLEGLTSNLFVVYPNHVIRTAGHGVLFGYVRHLLLELLSSPSYNGTMGSYSIDTSQQISMDDVNEWQEVFCTSSIRLIVPVERVFVSCGSNNSIARDADYTSNSVAVRELWSRPNKSKQGKELIWTKLRTLLLDKDNP